MGASDEFATALLTVCATLLAARTYNPEQYMRLWIAAELNAADAAGEPTFSCHQQ